MVCGHSLKIDRVETWRNVIIKFFNEIKTLKSIFEAVHQISLKSSDEDIRDSAVSIDRENGFAVEIDMIPISFVRRDDGSRPESASFVTS